MKTIPASRIRDGAVVRVPGSKSFTHRILIASSLAQGVSTVENALDSEDTRLTAGALRQMGAGIEPTDGRLRVTGTGGRLSACGSPIDLGNSGTSMRLLISLGAIGRGTYRFTGTPRMQQRPVQPLLDALRQLGVPARSVNGNGCPPVEVPGGSLTGTRTAIDCRVSSQYLSSLLLIAPVLDKGLGIEVTGGPVSKPYVDMTLDIMAKLGVTYGRSGYHRFTVPGGQHYRPGDYRVEPDASQASYFWAAGAVTGARVMVAGMPETTCQGDMRLLEVLERMGCRVDRCGEEGIAVKGGDLRGVDVDMGDMPDMVPTLSVVAAFAKGRTRIRNVGHLRDKESDRLAAVADGLTRMGVSVRIAEDGLDITGGRPVGAEIDPHDDHRIAMCFAVAGLRAAGTSIRNEGCVAKSFPGFWSVFQELLAP